VFGSKVPVFHLNIILLVQEKSRPPKTQPVLVPVFIASNSFHSSYSNESISLVVAPDKVTSAFTCFSVQEFDRFILNSVFSAVLASIKSVSTLIHLVTFILQLSVVNDLLDISCKSTLYSKLFQAAFGFN
jgi:hypothetical protein